ncbi:hypothetical protein OESDEN_04072 [Oesophagostomum dentatum]|uniref:Uncharacterized protein n=1 Tax=Oesophagostomum dentatum TaxID=61180 RepID=A0A0B1TKN1_OESDE|nr:hypothetical protein OESDEN_04072 [Oesophagostomum dentatum]
MYGLRADRPTNDDSRNLKSSLESYLFPKSNLSAVFVQTCGALCIQKLPRIREKPSFTSLSWTT